MSLYSCVSSGRIPLRNDEICQRREAERLQLAIESEFYRIMSCYVKNVKFMGITHNEQLAIFIDSRERFARKITKSSHMKFHAKYRAYNMAVSVLETSQSS